MEVGATEEAQREGLIETWGRKCEEYERKE